MGNRCLSGGTAKGCLKWRCVLLAQEKTRKVISQPQKEWWPDPQVLEIPFVDWWKFPVLPSLPLSIVPLSFLSQRREASPQSLSPTFKNHSSGSNCRAGQSWTWVLAWSQGMARTSQPSPLPIFPLAQWCSRVEAGKRLRQSVSTNGATESGGSLSCQTA